MTFVSVGVFFFMMILMAEEIASWIKAMVIAVILGPFAIGLTHLIWIFNAKLFALILSQNAISDRSSFGSNERSGTLIASNERLLGTVRKHTVLGGYIVM